MKSNFKDLIMHKFHFKVLILLIIVSGIFTTSCEDPVPTDYIPQNFVDGVLIVGDPIQNIVVSLSQPALDSFDFAASLIRDAEVIIRGDGRDFVLKTDQEGETGYYYDDETYLVKPNTTYELEVNLSDGTKITGKTETPSETEWVYRVKKQLQYPLDSIKLPATDSIAWQKVEGNPFFLISIMSLDTLEYGKYLDPPTEEMNRRIERPFHDDDFYREISQWGLIPNTKTSVVWSAFKWYGLQQVAIYVPDGNFFKWFLQHVILQEYDDLMGSVEGGFGVFGSASVIRDTTFLIKNLP